MAVWSTKLSSVLKHSKSGDPLFYCASSANLDIRGVYKQGMQTSRPFEINKSSIQLPPDLPSHNPITQSHPHPPRGITTTTLRLEASL